MISTTRQTRESGQPKRDFLVLSTVRLRLYWLFILLLSTTLLAACGGGGSGSANGGPAGPTANDLLYAQLAQLSASLDLATNWVTLIWVDAVPGASRYEIEQQNADGSWSVLDGVWATQEAQLPLQRLSLQWTGPVESATVLRVVAVMSGYTVTLSNLGAIGTAPTAENQQIAVTPPSQMPSIATDQAEPLQGSVGLSIENGDIYTEVSYSLDEPQVGSFFVTAAPYPSSFDFTGTTTGPHTLYAQLQVNASFRLVLSRSVQVHTSEAAEKVTVVNNPSDTDIYVVATSDSGIVSVTATVSSVTLDALTEPNACVPAPCSPGQSFNAYHFSVAAPSLDSIGYSLQVEATDAAGHVAYTFTTIELPSPTSATLASPVNNASVQGTLPISGTFASGTPGALELMVTLSGVPVYDTTVANPGSVVPFATNVSLAGVANGVHTVDVYARAGSASYELMASAFVMVTGAP
jgi:hypothetical protein